MLASQNMTAFIKVGRENSVYLHNRAGKGGTNETEDGAKPDERKDENQERYSCRTAFLRGKLKNRSDWKNKSPRKKGSEVRLSYDVAPGLEQDRQRDQPTTNY